SGSSELGGHPGDPGGVARRVVRGTAGRRDRAAGVRGSGARRGRGNPTRTRRGRHVRRDRPAGRVRRGYRGSGGGTGGDTRRLAGTQGQGTYSVPQVVERGQ